MISLRYVGYLTIQQVKTSGSSFMSTSQSINQSINQLIIYCGFKHKFNNFAICYNKIQDETNYKTSAN